ncbi:MAG: hypothetical protein ACRD4K_12790, partial [Candidatus Acidiferrales bacterium]
LPGFGSKLDSQEQCYSWTRRFGTLQFSSFNFHPDDKVSLELREYWEGEPPEIGGRPRHFC